MKLLFCIKSMNNSGGGAERVLADVASGFAERGHEVTVLSFDEAGGQSYYPLHEDIKRLELGVGSTTEPASFFMTLKRIFALRKAVKAIRPDVAIGFMHSMFIPLGIAATGTTVPVIASEHIVPEHYKDRPLQRLLLLLTPFVSSFITCVSEQARSAYPPFLRRTMVVLNNPVSLKVHSKADAAGVPGRQKILLSVGRLEEQKDQATLIEAFATIADKVPDWDLRIVGEGYLRGQLEERIAELGLLDRVHLPGATKQIAGEYAAAQLFVLPSRYESYGLTTAEALAHGLPAVGMEDCPGTNLLIHPKHNGELVRAEGDRVANLAQVLLTLMGNDSYRVSLAEQSGGLPSSHTPESVLEAWEALIARTLRASS